MKLVDIEKELDNLECIVLLFEGLGELSFYKNFGDMSLSGTIQESGKSYLITVSIDFFINTSDEEVCESEEELLKLEVPKTDINNAFKKVKHIIEHLNERFSREKILLESLPSDIKEDNDVKVDVWSKVVDTLSSIGFVFVCESGYLNRKGLINLYATLESISNASVVVRLSYNGALKYQRYVDANNVDEEIKNIEKCVEVFKENFIDGQVLLEELRNF